MRILLKAPTDPGFREMVIPSGDTDKELKLLQKLVGGRIEAVFISRDACVICNEEGRLLGLTHNCKFCGTDFVGPILLVGVDGDEFTDCPMSLMVANGGIE